VTLPDTDFERVGAAPPILVDFLGPGCGPGDALTPILDELAGAHAGKLRIGKVRLDLAPGLVARSELKAAPTPIVFAAGEEKKRITGVEGKGLLLRELEEFLP
jgi:thioredoxin 1